MVAPNKGFPFIDRFIGQGEAATHQLGGVSLVFRSKPLLEFAILKKDAPDLAAPKARMAGYYFF